MEIAYGNLQLTRSEFLKLRINEFIIRSQHYFKEKDEAIKLNFELMRRQTLDLINIQLDRNKKLTPHELWPAPWDEEEADKKELSEAEILENNQLLIDAINQLTT